MSDGRYSRSELFAGIGPAGQERICRARLALVGLGAVGSVAAEIAVRAGFGSVTLIDRDIVEESNLQRQFLFEEEDAHRLRPKAEAAAERLSRMNSLPYVRALAVDLNHGNAEELLAGNHVLIDGCDNFETRLLVSDTGKKLKIPVIEAACVGDEGFVFVSLPGSDSPCLRCFLGSLPAAGSGPTCETAGVVPSLPPLVASIAMSEALRLVSGEIPSRGVLVLSLWKDDFAPKRKFIEAASSPDCEVCAGTRYPALEGEGASEAAWLCGRMSVQLRPLKPERPNLDEVGRKLARFSPIRKSAFAVSASLEGLALTFFSDGRCLIRGTEDLARARGIVAKYVGR
jgi:adenylyltransferase/sulfurtransferase